MPTPPIPEWIRLLHHPAYRNIFSFNLGNANLWGTESLLGDWGGRFLLVAKDYYPSQEVEKNIRNNVANPYSHNSKAVTNRRLVEVLSHFGRINMPHDAGKCDFLYISACFLLRADNNKSGTLPDRNGVMKKSGPVVKFTMDNMPNLKTVVLMGDDAKFGFTITGNRELAEKRGLAIHHVSHPASRGLRKEERFQEWKPVFVQSP